nr:hypothetical protein [Natrialba sp. SSL1]
MIDPAIKTLLFEDTYLDFVHIQPASSLGSAVKLEPIKIRLSIIWWKELVEGSRLVGVELIHHNPDAVRIRVVNICELDHSVDPFCCPPLLGNFDVYPASQRFCREVYSLFPVAFVAVIGTGDRSRPDRERVAFVSS